MTTSTKRPDGGELNPLWLIDDRLEDLAQANVQYRKSSRLDAVGHIARNDREILWLKDLRSTLLLTRTLTNESPAPRSSAADGPVEDGTCYIERSKVREIILDDPAYTWRRLAHIDALPIFTARDFAAPPPEQEQNELRMLRERLGPRGLEVIEIDGRNHYVNEAVKAEIIKLRAEGGYDHGYADGVEWAVTRSTQPALPPEQGEAVATFNDPSDLWESYLEDLGGGQPSAQGAIAFAFDRLYTHAAPKPPAVTGEEQRPAPQPPVEGLREALEFYADPFAWKSKHDPDNVIQVPDFYSETSFGDTALEALAALASPSLTAGVVAWRIAWDEVDGGKRSRVFETKSEIQDWIEYLSTDQFSSGVRVIPLYAAPATLIEQSGAEETHRTKHKSTQNI